ncbi:MAG: hypothetical protein WC718_18215 [Phycisphaerales bacterium]|jgi:hypothetical protein
MADSDPMTKGECGEARRNCATMRTLENQNLVLNLRAEITGLLAETRRQIDAKFDRLLRDLGYVGETPAETAVHASRIEHPDRRDEDAGWKSRAFGWGRENFPWLLTVAFSGLAGAQIAPLVKRILDALTEFVVGALAK